ncbi:MAG: hypothetical protein ABIQ15_04410 [Nocardioides sp.]
MGSVRGRVRGAAVAVLGPERWYAARRRAGRVAPAEERRRRLAALDLTGLAKEFGTDKWGLHHYTRHYQHHLEHLRGRRFTLLEIGIGGYDRNREGGASLTMWSWFFPRARIVGLDIEDKSFVDGGRIRTVKGSQADPDVLARIVAEEGAPLVVVDDGSHRPEHIRATFAILFPLLPDGAVYAIEDCQTSYWPRWGGSVDRQDPTTTMALVKDLVDGLNHAEFLDEDHVSSYTDEHVRAVHCFHNLVIIEKGNNKAKGRRGRIERERRFV